MPMVETERAALGFELKQELEELKSRILDAPFSFPIFYNATRKASLRRFKYFVLFLVQDHTIFIISIVHAHRTPRELKRRIKKRT